MYLEQLLDMLLGHAGRQQTLLSHGILVVALLRHALIRLHGGHVVFLFLIRTLLSILFTPTSNDIAQIVQLVISHARLIGQHGNHPGRARSEGPAEIPAVVDGFLSQPEEPSAQSAVLAGGSRCAKGVVVTGLPGVKAGGRRKGRAGNREGDVWARVRRLENVSRWPTRY
jgi:hypothetical protein